MIKSIRSKVLEKFATKGDASKLPVQGKANLDRLTRQLTALNAAVKADDMNLPGYYFHALKTAPVRYSVRVTANYRLTYAWQDADAIDLDLEDYH